MDYFPIESDQEILKNEAIFSKVVFVLKISLYAKICTVTTSLITINFVSITANNGRQMIILLHFYVPGPPSPPVPKLPPCARTNYGCCWDNKTIAKGPTDDLAASQCPREY